MLILGRVRLSMDLKMTAVGARNRRKATVKIRTKAKFNRYFLM